MHKGPLIGGLILAGLFALPFAMLISRSIEHGGAATAIVPVRYSPLFRATAISGLNGARKELDDASGAKRWVIDTPPPPEPADYYFELVCENSVSYEVVFGFTGGDRHSREFQQGFTPTDGYHIEIKICPMPVPRPFFKADEIGIDMKVRAPIFNNGSHSVGGEKNEFYTERQIFKHGSGVRQTAIYDVVTSSIRTPLFTADDDKYVLYAYRIPERSAAVNNVQAKATK